MTRTEAYAEFHTFLSSSMKDRTADGIILDLIIFNQIDTPANIRKLIQALETLHGRL